MLWRIAICKVAIVCALDHIIIINNNNINIITIINNTDTTTNSNNNNFSNVSFITSFGFLNEYQHGCFTLLNNP